MFTNLLFRSIQVGEKAFHVLCDINLDVELWEKLGIEIIKDAGVIKKQIQDAQEQSKESVPEVKQEENVVSMPAVEEPKGA